MKSFLQTSFIVTMTLCVIAVIGLIAYGVIHPDAKPFDAKEYAKENHCPYEGNECPNAQAALAEHEECMQAADSIYLRNVELETQLAGYEFKDHSRLTSK